MRKALRINRTEAITWPDFSSPIVGRDDPPDMIENCWEFLAEEHDIDRQIAAKAPRKAQSQIVTARIRASATGLGSEAELRRKVERQQAAIERLLAFVPRRTPPLAAEALNEIARQLGRKATEVFRTEAILLTVAEETDDETTAPHRITVAVLAQEGIDPYTFVRQSFELQRWFAAEQPPEVLQAIRLFIEPGA